MHREISHSENEFQQDSNLSLYLMTGLLGVLIGIDLWPPLAGWLGAKGWSLPTWSREVYGYRFALIAAVLGGARILYTSLESLLEGRIGADLALAVACIAAILFNKPLVAAEVVFIGMVGECLESFTFERTRRAIRRIVEVCPRRCWLLRDGQEVRVLTSELHVGDRVVVKPGGRVPVDGIVEEGRSALDTSALTGESLPADVGPGDEVLAGSLNQFGALTIEARRVAEHTVVGRVIELTARALRDKATLERTADRLARYFLPVVLALAALTFVVGVFLNLNSAESGRRGLYEAARLSIDPTLAVLVVACPCALILATPAAIIAALGRLAGTGILIKGGSALERLAEVTAFAFDKTGTLTEGRLELGEVIGLDGISSDELLRAAAAAEQRSEHPLARLILQETGTRGLALEPVEEFQAHPGAGVTCRIADCRLQIADLLGRSCQLVVGTRRLLEEQQITLSAEALALLEKLDRAGQTPLLVACVGESQQGKAPRILGVIGARDKVRPEAAGVIAELRKLGLDIALLTGDRQTVARSLAGSLGITEVHAELLPAEKADFLGKWHSALSTQHSALHRVAMVGDGINDAPALASADVGLAIGGTGTDIAAEAGDLVLMGDPLRTLPLLVRLSRETVRIIRQNIFIFAFFVNGVGIVLTAWLWPLLTPLDWHEEAPLAAVLYHQLGSLAVLLNAMRLLWFERATASPGWLRLRQSFQALDEWMGRYLDPDEGLHWLSHRWKPVAGVAALLLLAVYLLSGLTQIGPDELGVARRFGRPLPYDLGPGLHWCWPWPVDQVTRLQPSRIHTVEIGFRVSSTAPPGGASGAWSIAHRDAVALRPEEAVMITGDGNLVEMQAVVRYTIEDPRLYLFEVSRPEELIRSTMEAVLREAVAGRPFLELLTAERGPFQQEVLERLARRCQEYGGQGLGIHLDSLTLPDLHPPLEVVQAYHDVARKMEERDRLVNEAQAEAIGKESNSQAEALRMVRQAEAEKHKKIQFAQADQAAFLARLQARGQLTAQQEAELWQVVQVAAKNGSTAADARREYERRRAEMLAAQAVLTDFRLFWDALGKAMAGREKVIIDSDKLSGRRNLMLFDPDKFRVPVPVIPTERTLPPRGPVRPEGHEGP